ncbi:MAG TPA: LysE family translocator [Paracoccaceae bacterium]|nr:LysE family translocator [Paracoccaceae bacterium]HMO70545.1 LysE family translocator [Paracoccaceae bacterium]
MTPELVLSLAGFAFATSVTPGPNNLMLLASGVNFGLRRTVPHMLGISFGHALMVFLVGMGLSGLFQTEPRAALALKLASVVYMVWLAWKIAHAAPVRPGAAAGQPFTALQAAGFQWVNPKAWAMALTATAVYAPGGGAAAMAAVAAVFAAVNLPSVAVWAAAGQALRRWLEKGQRRLWFNRGMALLLVASLWPVLRM